MNSARTSETATFFAVDLKTWRKWLEKNHTTRDEVWLVFYKIHVGKSGISYDDSVQEALCFGWIDGKVRRIDDERYMIRFTPRKAKSAWSAANVRRVEKLIEQDRMTDAGLSHVNAAKKDGRWKKALDDEKERKKKVVVPDDLGRALVSDPGALKNFNQMAQGYRREYIRWIESAKREETRKRRIKEVVERSAKDLKPGM